MSTFDQQVATGNFLRMQLAGSSARFGLKGTCNGRSMMLLSRFASAR
jgi:hypothetical protein